jgi:hypothetical protein
MGLDDDDQPPWKVSRFSDNKSNQAFKEKVTKTSFNPFL